MEAKVSVIMSAYNSGQFIKSAIESVINQTYNNWELIIVDDCSTDNTLQIATSFAQSYDNIQVFHNSENLGPAATRNVALSHTTGEYIAVLDSDDISSPKRLDLQVTFMEQNQDIAACGSAYYEIDNSGKRTALVNVVCNPEELACSMLFTCSFAHSSVIMRKSFLDEHNLCYDLSFPCSQDYLLWSKILTLGKIANLPQPLVEYRIWDGQVSAKSIEKQKLLAERVSKPLLDFAGMGTGPEVMLYHRRLSHPQTIIGKANNCHSYETKDFRELADFCWALYATNNHDGNLNPRALAKEILLRTLRFCRFNYNNLFGCILLITKTLTHLPLVLPLRQMRKRRRKKL